MKSEITWQDILNRAISEPGAIHSAYHSFHGYSLGNQMLAMEQCFMRGIPPGPISTYPGWQAKGRQVKKGEKAICLWMPIIGKKHIAEKDQSGNETEKDVPYTRFILKNNWFVMSQTDGNEFQPEPIADWNPETALQTLSIAREEFNHTDGNVQGYAKPSRKLALNPIGDHPNQTLFHEMAHILLGHCEQGMNADGERTPRSLREVEAESVALLCSESLGMSGSEYSRGYIQNWAPGLKAIPEKSCQAIFKAATMILEAGRKPLPAVA